MVRGFDAGRPVDREVLSELLDLALRAPSAGHSQGRDLLVLHTPDQRETFWAAATAPDRAREPDRWLTGMRTAPCLVLCLADPQRYLDRYAEPDKGWTDRSPDRWPVPYWDVDTGFSALLLLLGAVDAGLCACFFGVPGERVEAVKAAFGVPGDRRIVGVVALGHPAADRRSPSLRRGRRPAAQVLHEGRFGRPFPR